ncbi:hypothetical protein [Deinococcus rufus]|uniref:Polymerase n=1 Tax=Deinococcus rufus TaxID=2136097 RepID=A0ABV7ZA10_9DEIO
MSSVFWIALVLIALVRVSTRPDRFITWIAVFACFPAAAVISVGSGPSSIGLSPYYVLAAWAAVSCVRRPRALVAFLLRPPQIYLLLFVLYAVVGAVVLPLLFSGTGVYSPRLGIDSQVSRQTPLILSPSQIGQAGYLLLNYGVYLFIAQRGVVGHRHLVTALYVAAAVSLWQLLSLVTPLPFAQDIVASNQAYAYLGNQQILGVPRINGSFLEVSMASAFFAVMYAHFARTYLDTGRGAVPAVVALLATAFSLSTTGTVVIALVTVALIGTALLRLVRQGRVRRQDVILVLVLAGVVLGAASVSQYLFELTVNKFGTSSYSNRGASNAYALDLLLDTFGLGVGLGSNRPSSFAAYLLSNLGIVPSVLLGALIVSLLWRAQPRVMAWTLGAYLGAKLLSLPDLNDYWLWVLLAQCQLYRPPSPAVSWTGGALAVRR